MNLSRAGAEQEKRELHGLNQRFEFYILQQREKDAMTQKLQDDLNELRANIHKEKVNSQVRHHQHVDSLNKQSADKHAELKEKKDSLLRKTGEMDDLAAKLEACKAQATQVQELHKLRLLEHADLKRDNFDKHSQVGELERRRDAQARHLEDMQATLPLVQKEIQDVTQAFFAEHANGEEVDKILREEQADFEAHMNEHHTEMPIAEVHFKEQAKVHHDDRKEVLLEELAKQQAERHKANMDTLTHLYEQKCVGYRTEIEKLQAQVEDKTADTALDQDQIHDAIAALNDKIAGLQDDIANQKATNALIAENKNAEIAALKAAVKNKMHEMDELMVHKLRHVVHLNHMQELLDKEEKRLGIHDDDSDIAPLARSGSKRKSKTPIVSTRTSSRLKRGD